MKIWAHTIVRNEEKWVWYSVTSVIDYVDKVLLWDMDSSDNTQRIIKEIEKKYPEKVFTKIVPQVSPEGFAKVRQDMLDATDSDWFLVVDGDEVWWEDSIKRVVKEIKNTKPNEIESIVVPLINLIGDLYHYQEEKAGLYSLIGKKGNYSIRAIKRDIPGLSSSKPHGKWGWTDKYGLMIQDRDKDKIRFLDAPYIHATYMSRGGSRSEDKNVIKRAQKYKYELGIPFPYDFYYPEVFFRRKPEIVPSPWLKMDSRFYARALVETPLRKIKRRVLKPKSGY